MNGFKFVISIFTIMVLGWSIQSSANKQQSFSCPTEFPQEFSCANLDSQNSKSGYAKILVCGESQKASGPEDIVLVVQDKEGASQLLPLESLRNIGSGCYLHYLGNVDNEHQNLGLVACYFGSQAWLRFTSPEFGSQTENFVCKNSRTNR